MSNNIDVTPGVGKTVATEEISGFQYQKAKITGGEAGSTSMMSVGPLGEIRVSILGTPTFFLTGSVIAVSTGSVRLASSNASVITLVQGSVATVQIGTQITSLVSTVPSSVIVGASIFGQLPAGTATIGAVTAPAGSVMTTVRPAGSVTAIANLAGSIAAVSATAPAGSVLTVAALAGSVTAVRTDNASVITLNQSSSIIALVTGSVATVFQGSVLTIPTSSTITVLQSSSLIAINAGSVVTLSSGSVITVWKDSSVVSVPVGSVITVFQAPSIVGSYAEDAAHTTADKGLFVLGVRNDNMASVTSSDGDYGAYSLGAAGEMIVANAPLTKWVRGTSSLLTAAGGSIIAIAAPGASIFTYITGLQFAGYGSQSVLLTIAGGLGSTLGQYVVPAGGTQTAAFIPNALKTGENSAITTSIGGSAAITSSVYVQIQGFTAKI